jgi:HEAT repeat protein
MRTALKCCIVAGLIVAVSLPALATDKVQVAPKVTKDLIVTNLMNGLTSQNRGLKESAAFMLGEEKAIRAVVPLMQMLRGGQEESSRIVAALSLCRIGDPRGVYAVKQAAKFDESDRVRTLCAYNQYVQPGSFDFVAVQPAASVEYGSR